MELKYSLSVVFNFVNLSQSHLYGIEISAVALVNAKDEVSQSHLYGIEMSDGLSEPNAATVSIAPLWN